MCSGDNLDFMLDNDSMRVDDIGAYLDDGEFLDNEPTCEECGEFLESCETCENLYCPNCGDTECTCDDTSEEG